MRQIRIWCFSRENEIRLVRAENSANMTGDPAAIAMIDGVLHEIYLRDWRTNKALPKTAIRHAEILRAIRRRDMRCDIVIYGIAP